MGNRGNAHGGVFRALAVCLVTVLCAALPFLGQTQKSPAHGAMPGVAKKIESTARPKLIVMLVVDQMRGDYVDKFQGQWSSGFKRLLGEGAWFRSAAYPYAATETCPGHATISTGAFPASHGIVANAWWDRDTQRMVTCTSDSNVKNSAYAGRLAKSGDSALRMRLPAFAEELKFQSGAGARVVTFSLKARAAITLAGHRADAVTWSDGETGAWLTSSAYGMQSSIEGYAVQHPVTADYGKTWSLSLPKSSYLYDESATGAGTVPGWTAGFPHALKGKEGTAEPDIAFFEQWGLSPFADTYLTKMAEATIDGMALGKGPATDYLGISYSTPDYVGHRFGPRSWEIQDILIRLDKDLGELFAFLDQKVGKGNYVVALTADHGVAPIPTDMQKTGFDAGVLNLAELKDRMERALGPYSYPDPAIAKIAENQVYFSRGTFEKLKQDPAARKALLEVTEKTPGVAEVFWAEELRDGIKTVSATRTAAALSFFPERSGDLFVLQRPYWLLDGSAASGKGYTGTGHGSPYYYDQRVPLFLMGFGIKPGEYFNAVTPADIAPTFATLTGVTLATRDGHVLSEALLKK
jgi:predicted AlkP superfamily pyrophosphatase or phosphodiesterase